MYADVRRCVCVIVYRSFHQTHLIRIFPLLSAHPRMLEARTIRLCSFWPSILLLIRPDRQIQLNSFLNQNQNRKRPILIENTARNGREVSWIKKLHVVPPEYAFPVNIGPLLKVTSYYSSIYNNFQDLWSELLYKLKNMNIFFRSLHLCAEYLSLYKCLRNNGMRLGWLLFFYNAWQQAIAFWGMFDMKYVYTLPCLYKHTSTYICLLWRTPAIKSKSTVKCFLYPYT